MNGGDTAGSLSGPLTRLIPESCTITQLPTHGC